MFVPAARKSIDWRIYTPDQYSDTARRPMAGSLTFIKLIGISQLMHIKETIHVAVPPVVIDQIWSEVDRWHLWDPDTKQARLNGPFAVGTHGRIVPSKGMGIPMLVTERSAGRSFTVEGYIPLFRIHFEHTVFAADGGSEVVHRVWFSGALAFLFGPSVARQVREGLPGTMRSLKAYAEKRNETPP